MTEQEIRMAEKMAREWLGRTQSTQARMKDTANPGIVSKLCETIIALATETKKARARL